MDTIDSIASQPDAKVVFLLLFLAEIGDVLNILFYHFENLKVPLHTLLNEIYFSEEDHLFHRHGSWYPRQRSKGEGAARKI